MSYIRDFTVFLLSTVPASESTATVTVYSTEYHRLPPNHAIDPSHKSHYASDNYLTMHHFVTEMSTHVQISVTKWCIVGYGTGALWDMCNRSIADAYSDINRLHEFQKR